MIRCPLEEYEKAVRKFKEENPGIPDEEIVVGEEWGFREGETDLSPPGRISVCRKGEMLGMSEETRKLWEGQK